MISTTVGQLLLNEALPEDMRDYGHRLDKKGATNLFQRLAEKHPDQYRDVAKKLFDVARETAYSTGGMSFGLDHIVEPPVVRQFKDQLKRDLAVIKADKSLSDALDARTGLSERDTKVLKLLDERGSALSKLVHSELSKSGNPLAEQVTSGARGNPIQLRSLVGGDMTYVDHRDRPIPIPILHSYSQGLSPAEYFAGSYGARKGVISVKFCLDGSTKVLLPTYGIKDVREIVAGDFVMGADRSGRSFPARVTKVFDNGTMPCYRYRFRKGECRNAFLEMVATEDHKILAECGAKEGAHGPAPVPLRLASFRGRVSTSDFRALVCRGERGLDRVKEDRALVAGLMLGGGHVTPPGYEVSDVSCADEALPAHMTTMPAEVWGWDDESVADFVGGLFSTAGSVKTRKSGCSVAVSLTAKDLIFDLQRLLELRLGVWTSPVKSAPARAGSRHGRWTFHVSHPESLRRFADRVRLVGVKRQELENALIAPAKKQPSEDYYCRAFDREYAGELATFDIEIDHPDHMFVLANGLIVSNSTQEAGAFSKQLNSVAHKLIVTAKDYEHDGTPRGLPADTDDPDNAGALLAQDVGPYKRNSVLTPKVLADLKAAGHHRILVRSPAVGGAPDGGLYSYDAGMRERGIMTPLGDQVGVAAAQSLSEPVSQASLGAKHTGGIAAAGSTRSGFDYINQLANIPKHFPGGATHSALDGKVDNIEEAPTGGWYVTVGGEEHYVNPGRKLTVNKGDVVEAGDTLSDGTPNPAELVRHKGIGEGRRRFVDLYRQAYKDSGIPANRRNIEVLARGLIDHVKLHEEVGPHVPGDVVNYSTLEHDYEPRPGNVVMMPKSAVGKYLEKPVLHHTIGTVVKPSMLKEMDHFGVKAVTVHPDPPPFEPEMVRAAGVVQHDPDWMVRLGVGTNLKKNLLRGVARGDVSDETGLSYVPGLARAVDFGRVGPVKDWHTAVLAGPKKY